MYKIYSFFDLIMAVGIGWAFYAALNSLDNWNQNKRLVFRNILLTLLFSLILIDHLIKPEFEQSFSIFLFLCITRNIYFLIGPLLWIYTKGLLDSSSHFRLSTLIHVLPFLFWFILNILFPNILLIFPANPDPITNMSGPPLAEPFAPVHHWIWLSRVRDLGSILSVLVYGIFCYIRLKQHQRQVPRFYSSRDTRKTLSWLSILIFVIIIVNSLNLILISINPADTPIFFLRFHSAYLRSFPAMLFLLYFSYFSRKQDSTENIRENEKKEKYQKQLMTKDERDSLYQRINRAMESKKFYLNPDLSLEELAKELGESKHQISQVLNSWEGKNFFTFINDYRIKEFIKSVEEDKYPNFTMLGIAMECGFRSSSSFYSLFKKAIGKTPRQYISEMKKYA